MIDARDSELFQRMSLKNRGRLRDLHNPATWELWGAENSLTLAVQGSWPAQYQLAGIRLHSSADGRLN